MGGRYGKKKGLPILLIAAALGAALALGCFIGQNRGRLKERVELRYEGRILTEISDPSRIRELKDFLAAAEDIGYEPKTYLPGAELVYVNTDGQEILLELDLYGDMFRYEGRFFDYGPGNDNNAMPRLMAILGLEDWPKEVKEAYPFIEESGTATVGTYRQQSVYMDLWYPDWYYVKIPEIYAVVIEEALGREDPVAVDRNMIPVEESLFTIHIAYDDRREYDLACIGESDFLLWECGTGKVYSISDGSLRETVDRIIALSKDAVQ